MVIFHTYVSLPEGKLPKLFFVYPQNGDFDFIDQ